MSKRGLVQLPFDKARNESRTPRQMARAPLVPIFIVLNVAVFLMWQFSGHSAQFMEDNFTVSWTGIESGHYWTLVTSVFSHTLIWHLLLNMFVLRSFGTLIEQVLGSWRFFKFYLFAGISGSMMHVVLSAFFLNVPDMAAVGASGAIAGLILVFALLFPREKILLFAIIPVPALLGAFAFMALDIWGLMSQAEGGGLPIGHGAHLGGAAAGILYYITVLHTYRRVLR